MSNISVNITDDLKKKIAKIARKSGCSVEDCISLALAEYVENCSELRSSDLCAVNNLERSFFLSIGE